MLKKRMKFRKIKLLRKLLITFAGWLKKQIEEK